MDIEGKAGSIEVICGCMFAGKTEELVRRIRRMEYAKKSVIIFKPVIDNRYSNDEVVSHNNRRVKSVQIREAKDIYKYIDEANLPYAIAIDEVQFLDNEVVSHNNRRVKSVQIREAKDIYKYIDEANLPYAIAIDEVQFLDNEVVDVCEHFACLGVRVIAAGLDQDFRGEPFGVMPLLLAKAEEVTKLSAICQVCGAPATRTQRIINGKPADYNDPVVLVGAMEQYEARCRHHHEVPGKKK